MKMVLDIIKPVKLKTIVRQRDAHHLQAVVEAAAGNIEKTFALHKHNISSKQKV